MRIHQPAWSIAILKKIMRIICEGDSSTFVLTLIHSFSPVKMLLSVLVSSVLASYLSFPISYLSSVLASYKSFCSCFLSTSQSVRTAPERLPEYASARIINIHPILYRLVPPWPTTSHQTLLLFREIFP